MIQHITPAILKSLLEGESQFALLDVREPGEFNTSHIPGASILPRRQLEFRVSFLVPFKGAHVVVCDDDGRRAKLAAATLERMGYQKVSVLEGGLNRWVTENYPTEWGTNVPSKDFGEKVEVLYKVPVLEATELHARLQRGEKVIILDTRTPEEFQLFCIPGGRNVPGAELALRITDILKEVDTDTMICVNCAGRTRSIIGTRILQRMGIKHVYGLKNGTAGWMLAGYDLERGANRLKLPSVSAEGLAKAEDYADRLAAEDGVRYLDIPGLQAVLTRREQETVYLIDVRTREEYQQGHIPGFQWFPGGQAVQQSDELAVKNSTIVFACDRKARATFTASWYRQMGFREVYVVDGGTQAWTAAGLNLEHGFPPAIPFGLSEAKNVVRLLSPQEVQEEQNRIILFVDPSTDFARGHIPGAHWVPRGWLELRIGELVPHKDTPLLVTCVNGLNAMLAGATLIELRYRQVAVLDGGLLAWQQAGLPLEKGLSGVMVPPRDVVFSGPDRTYAEMIDYLRWEENLGKKYETQQA